MGSIFGGSGGEVQGPGGTYSGGGFVGQSDAKPTGIFGPPDDGLSGDPTVLQTSSAKVGSEGVDQSSDGQSSGVNLTWEQRALRLLSGLVTAKGFKDLPGDLTDEVLTLIAGAPDDART